MSVFLLCLSEKCSHLFAYIRKKLYLFTAKAVHTLKVCAYVRAKYKFLRKTKKNLRISIIFTTFAAVFKLLKVIYISVMLL